MEEIRRCTEDLIEAIRKSDVYREYEEARLALAAHPDLRNTINEFRKRSYEIQNSDSPEDVYEKMEQLERDFYMVRRNDIMNNYLQAELAICRTLQTINQELVGTVDLDILDFRVEEKEHDRIEVFTKHAVDGHEAELNLSDESSGTKKLFGLLPFIAESLIDGTTLVIDELDAKIHPVLLRYIIMLYNNMEANRKGAQLIFTSHDLSTMNSEVFRRDEIWFVAKGNNQNSKLYSLVEFKNSKGESVRKDAKFDKQYLEGKYGADPYLRKIIDWGSVNA